MHRRPKLPTLGQPGSPAASGTSPSSASEHLRGGTEDEERRASGHTRGIHHGSGSSAASSQHLGFASGSPGASPSNSGQGGSAAKSLARPTQIDGEEDERRQEERRHAGSRHGQRRTPVMAALLAEDEERHSSIRVGHRDRSGFGSNSSSHSASVAAGAAAASALAAMSGPHHRGTGSASTPEAASSSSGPSTREVQPLARELQPRDPQSLPSLGTAVRPKPASECSRQPSPVRSTAAPSSSSRRSSSSTGSHFGPFVDPQQPNCPAPPPEVAVLSAPLQPARSQALPDSRTGSRTPDPSRGRTPDVSTGGSRTPSGCRTPDVGNTNATSLRPANIVAAQEGEDTFPLCRAGWSGTLDGDHVLDLSPEGAETTPKSPGTPLSPWRHKDHASPSSSSSRGATALPSLSSKAGKTTSIAGAAEEEAATSSGQSSERRRRPRQPASDVVRASSVGLAASVAAALNEPASPPLRPGLRKGATSPQEISRSSAAVAAASAFANANAPAKAAPSDELRHAASASSIHSSLASSQSASRLQKPKSMRNPRQQLRNGSRDDSFLSTISESTRSSDSTSTDEKQQRDSKTMVMDGSQIEVFSEAASSENRGQVEVIKDFRQLFKQEGDASSEHMQLLLRQYGFDKPLEMQRRVMPLVMSAFRDEQKTFITVQGAPQCGKTSALVLGILGAIGAEMVGIRAVVVSTSSSKDFRKYFDICAEAHPLRLECFEGVARKVSFEGLPPDPDSAMAGVDPLEDLQRLSSALGTGTPAMVFGHPSRVLPLLREAPSWGVDLSNVQVLALDDAEDTICMGLMDEVCEICTILRHFSEQRLRHIILSHFLSHEAKSMIRCLRNSLLRQQNLFGIRAHRTQARAKSVNHYYAVAPRARWPAMLAALHHALSLPSGIIFDDASAETRASARLALRALGVTASVWNALQEQGSGARAAARDGTAAAPRGPAFHLMPSDLVVLKVDLPQVRCVLHFEVPRRELSVYGLRLMCLEQQEQKKSSRKGGPGGGGRSLSVLFVEEEEVVRELEKTFHVRMEEVPTEMLVV